MKRTLTATPLRSTPLRLGRKGSRLVTVDGVSVEGVLATSEGVHSECVAVIGGHWGSKSAYMPIAKDKGVPVVHLVPGQTPDRMDHVCSAFDQCIRVKLEKIA